MMLFARSPRSANHLYLEARSLWTKVVNLNIYDSEDMLASVARLLQQARQQNPRHIPSLVLLSDVLMALGADGKALEVVDSLIALQPDNQTHTKKQILLHQLQASPTDDNREAVRDFVEARWTQTNDW
ncbi:MAG: tetratricopeptide repeat protein [Leptolyngbyaceae cyanobacterium MAG.088]|nr:tetratricopeptide repeat protein [Leptolyngbyaceae cyanobacterium MAG.088]